MWVRNGDVLGQDDLCYRAVTLTVHFPLAALETPNWPVMPAGTHNIALRVTRKCAEIAYGEVLSAPRG